MESVQLKANQFETWYDGELFQQCQEHTLEILGKEGAFLVFGNSRTWLI